MVDWSAVALLVTSVVLISILVSLFVARERRFNSGARCRYCMTQDLVWKYSVFSGWRLFHPEGKIHVCDPDAYLSSLLSNSTVRVMNNGSVVHQFRATKVRASIARSGPVPGSIRVSGDSSVVVIVLSEKE